MRALVTGGCGFIASDLTRLLAKRGDSVCVIDSLTYAGSLDAIEGVGAQLVKVNVTSPEARAAVFDWRPDIIFHAAAESHVDRSIASYRPFIETNVNGTWNLLEACRELRPKPLFIYISTDEVYGSLPHPLRADETFPLAPANPYAVSKTAAEHAVRAAANTWGQPYIITRSCNNFGPRQHPEKLIPGVARAILADEPVQLHGRGEAIREWIYVRDHTVALALLAARGTPCSTYNITTGWSLSCNEVADAVASTLARPMTVTYVPDRPGNDARYAMSASRLYGLGWQPSETFNSALRRTLDWYAAHTDWLADKDTSANFPSAQTA